MQATDILSRRTQMSLPILDSSLRERATATHKQAIPQAEILEGGLLPARNRDLLQLMIARSVIFMKFSVARISTIDTHSIMPPTIPSVQVKLMQALKPSATTKYLLLLILSCISPKLPTQALAMRTPTPHHLRRALPI